MPGLRLYVSNRLERLSACLAGLLEHPGTDPFRPETIVVQSFGMQRWVSLQLASRHGVCANCEFPFPNAFVEDLFRRALPQTAGVTFLNRDILAWRIMERLPDLLTHPEFERLRHYLAPDTSGLRLFQLASSLADTFDQYVIFRPEIIRDWERGQLCHDPADISLERWQARLWNALQEGGDWTHRARLREAFFEALPALAEGILPERVFVFGISSLPRFHLEILTALALRSDVYIYLMNPCREFWGDIRSKGEIASLSRRAGGSSAAELYLDEGHPLLASLGGVGRDFFALLCSCEGQECELFEDVPDDTLLHGLQHDILNLKSDPGSAPRPVSGDDRSLQVHACHGPMREIEVLHDHLLELLDRSPDIAPRDIIVMAPDIEAYAPYIQAVFERGFEDPGRIPYGVADRSLRTQSPVVKAFFEVLDLATSRLPASRVYALIGTPVVCRRFGIASHELDYVRQWIEETGIRWGLDQGFKVALGLPATRENTWRAGIDRLLLGYALTGSDEEPFDGILPYDEVEGGRGVLLGRFLSALEALFAWVASLGAQRDPAAWAADLERMTEELFDVETDEEPALQALRAALKGLAAGVDQGGFRGTLTLEVVRAALVARLDAVREKGRFIAGGVTFCSLLPMRSIPFKVVCLLGMHHDAYPRSAPECGYDLIARHPRPGDRSRRDDDRYLFLEALLSAREVLYISYRGQDPRENTPLSPSVLVSELLEVLEESCAPHEGTLKAHVRLEHRLQAFSPAYFTGEGRLFSYAAEHCEAARALAQRSGAEPSFTQAPLSAPGDDWRTLDLDDLCAFYRHPARFLLTRRLGLTLSEGPPELVDREPFDLAGLERYHVREFLARRALAGAPAEATYAVLLSGGRLPHGIPGQNIFHDLARETQGFVERLRAATGGRTPVSEPFELELAGLTLGGQIEAWPPGGVIVARNAVLTPRDLVLTWIRHLVLCVFHGGEAQVISCCIGADRLVCLKAPSDARARLSELLGHYGEGLCRVLPFFPASSLAYAQAVLAQGKDPAAARLAARDKWLGFKGGEGEDPYNRLCFRDETPLNEEFAQLALGVFGPLLECLVDGGRA